MEYEPPFDPGVIKFGVGRPRGLGLSQELFAPQLLWAIPRNELRCTLPNSFTFGPERNFRIERSCRLLPNEHGQR
jgi:hypothetical protein